MFKKPFKVKHNTQLKGSDRKKLRSEILKQFHSLSEELLTDFIPNKEAIFSVKIQTHSGETVVIYTVQKLPIVFEIEGSMYPTVYMLWSFPDLLPAFTTHPQVFPAIAGGADLMLPGVVLKGPTITIDSYGKLNKGAKVCINLTNNKAPVAVGKAHHSSHDMYMSARRGKCVNVLHFYGDYLAKYDTVLPVPTLGLVIFDEECSSDSNNDSITSEIEHVKCLTLADDSEIVESFEDQVEDVIENLIEGNGCSSPSDKMHSEDDNETAKEELDNSEELMNELLMFCFFKSIKTTAKKIVFPILTSNFYRLHIIVACPEGKTLDIKKTKYKKLSNFLEEIAATKLITLETISKGVLAITSIQYCHELLKEFSEKYIFKEVPEDAVKKQATAQNSTSSVSAPDIVEKYTVNATTLPLFSLYLCKKGDSIPKDSVRKYITEYVKVNNLVNCSDRSLVNFDSTLANIIGGQTSAVTWDVLFKKVIDKMGQSFEMSTGVKSAVVIKGKLPPIDIQVGSRTGNKKVTLVNNLELYGINLKEFSQGCQHGVAASTTINRPPELKSAQVQIQGNQTAFVSKLLMEKYQIPKKFLRGLENIPAKKKNKKA